MKHIEFYSKNKFEKLMYLVGFIIRIYHDARSAERQNHQYIFPVLFVFSLFLPFRLSLFGDIPSLYFLPVRPHHLSSRDFIDFPLFAPCNVSRVSLFVMATIHLENFDVESKIN